MYIYTYISKTPNAKRRTTASTTLPNGKATGASALTGGGCGPTHRQWWSSSELYAFAHKQG